ncbi:MAG TPA: beta-N-acetylhexosaminidase, partial [Candidatus Binatia bacterium]|nr:beta-N-acetylhexosaminidase [Candidatus Binatia bacterium]
MPTLREKIAQLFLVGIGSSELTSEERRAIEHYGFGGFILFGRNCCDPSRIVSLTRTLWSASRGLPPFIAIDQEGGRIHRLPKPFTHFPAAAEIGATGDAHFAYRAARATAAELALAGINLDFAPVLDVNSNPKNPVIGDRSFATDPQKVIAFGAQWISGLRDGGIIPCGKHFPGHGETDKDSHLDLPVVDRSLHELERVELPPFVHACRNGIESLMTAHVIYRALDSKFPATLSRTIVTELLRRDLNYQGVVFTDDMEMKAISEHYGEAEAVALCVRAGIDVMLFVHELSGAIHACDFLCAEFEKDAKVRAQVETSHKRIA